MYYQRNRLRARTENHEPSMTEQSGARETDINVIVKRFAVTGQTPGSPTPPITGDFSDLPTDLRGFLDTARSLRENQYKLPDQLRNIPLEQLLAMNPKEIANILKPPAPAPAPEPKETK